MSLAGWPMTVTEEAGWGNNGEDGGERKVLLWKSSADVMRLIGGEVKEGGVDVYDSASKESQEGERRLALRQKILEGEKHIAVNWKVLDVWYNHN